jgi:hypothetical protein
MISCPHRANRIVVKRAHRSPELIMRADPGACSVSKALSMALTGLLGTSCLSLARTDPSPSSWILPATLVCAVQRL